MQNMLLAIIKIIIAASLIWMMLMLFTLKSINSRSRQTSLDINLRYRFTPWLHLVKISDWGSLSEVTQQELKKLADHTVKVPICQLWLLLARTQVQMLVELIIGPRLWTLWYSRKLNRERGFKSWRNAHNLKLISKICIKINWKNTKMTNFWWSRLKKLLLTVLN